MPSGCNKWLILPCFVACWCVLANKVLGVLPPARSIAHVQQSSPSGPPVSANQQPVVSWANTVANVNPTWSWPGTSTQLLAQPPPTHAGLTLSPAAETFPKKIVEKAQSGQFMEMKELLADNMALISQLDTVSGLSTSHMFGAARPRLREVTSLPIWCYCFMGYMALCTSDPATRDQLAYARLLIKEAQRHGGLGWLDYDRAFRQQAAADPSIRWNTLIPGLQASTILGQQQAGPGLFCTLCRQVDHTRSQCALGCLEPPPVSSAAQVQAPPVGQGRRRRVCISWNKGDCIFPEGECSYLHECPSCKVTDHRARDCAKVPETSVYKKRRAQPPTSRR